MVKFKNVTKTFGDVVAIKDVSFEIEKGEFVYITGPSGSGKTTILKLILKEILPDSGKIFFGAQDIEKIPEKELPLYRRKIGCVFQDFKVLPEKTVRENIQVALAAIGVPEDKWEKKVDEVLRASGIEKRADFFPLQLSGGELQRVSFARALAVKPELILADEPTGNLDWDTAKGMMDLFEKTSKEGITVIMATHNSMIIDKIKKREIKLK
ncbi:MAG: ATP-binding cassette domain-containing protein [bacterium]|nr:ATP-binding cassette domain-containing protein [bacterium]